MRILFIGDIFGRPGRNIVKDRLPGIVRDHGIDLIIANGPVDQLNREINTPHGTFGIATDEGSALIVLLFIRNGVLLDKRTFEFKNMKLDSESLLIEFLNRYYTSEVYTPHEILIPMPINLEALEFDAKILVPRSSEKKGFIEIAQENADIQLKTIRRKLQTRLLKMN